jgi:hypothetical protein
MNDVPVLQLLMMKSLPQATTIPSAIAFLKNIFKEKVEAVIIGRLYK